MKKILYVYSKNHEAFKLLEYIFTNYYKINEISRHSEEVNFGIEKIKPMEYTLREIGRQSYSDLINKGEHVIVIGGRYPKDDKIIIEEYDIVFRKFRNALFVNNKNELLIRPTQYYDFLRHIAQINLWFKAYPKGVSPISRCELGDGGQLSNASLQENRILARKEIIKSSVKDCLLPGRMVYDVGSYLMSDLKYVSNQQYKYSVLILALNCFEKD